MKTASIKQIQEELKLLESKELHNIIIKLARFKKDNKELLTYLLFEAGDEAGYVNYIKESIDEEFDKINFDSFFYIKKSLRRILKQTKLNIKYSPIKETEVSLLLYFCQKCFDIKPDIHENIPTLNIVHRELNSLHFKIKSLHPDLQLDYLKLLEALENH